MKDLITWLKRHQPVDRLSEYWQYEYEDGHEWFVPLEIEQCSFCNGDGYHYHNREQIHSEDCPDCDGRGYFDIPLYDLVIDSEEYHSMKRQHYWLERRYGRVPSSISDYWQVAS